MLFPWKHTNLVKYNFIDYFANQHTLNLPLPILVRLFSALAQTTNLNFLSFVYTIIKLFLISRCRIRRMTNTDTYVFDVSPHNHCQYSQCYLFNFAIIEILIISNHKIILPQARRRN